MYADKPVVACVKILRNTFRTVIKLNKLSNLFECFLLELSVYNVKIGWSSKNINHVLEKTHGLFRALRNSK